MSFEPIEVADDKDILVFHDILGQESGSSQQQATTNVSGPASNSLLHPSSSSQRQAQRAVSPSEDSPLKSDGQIGPRKPSIECCGFGLSAVVLVTASMTLAFALTIGLVLSIRFGPPQIPPSGSVTSPAPECSKIGLDLLKDRSASAADAAIAMALCAGVVRAESSGLGGDGFAIFHDHRRSQQAVINGRSCSPADVTPLKNAISSSNTSDFSNYRLTGWAVGTPTELALFWALQQRRGKLAWPELFKPVIEVARNGFKLTPETVQILSSSSFSLADFVSKTPKIAELYVNTGNMTVRPAGTLIKRPDLANLLERIASNGTYRYFYENDPARRMSEAINKQSPGNQGLFPTFNFISQCTALKEEPPLNSTFKEYMLLFPGLPSSAIAVAEILGVLSTSNYTKLQVNKDYADIHHVVAEASKFALADLYQTSSNDSLEMLLNATYWRDISSRLDAFAVPKTWDAYSRFMQKVAPLPQAETTGNFVAALDQNENFVAFSLSLGSPFGSMVTSDDGVVLNNHMEAFYYDSASTSHPNYIAGNKKPMSVQAPMIAHVPQSCKIRTAVGTVPFLASPMPGLNLTRPSGWHVIADMAEVMTRLLGGSRESQPLSLSRWRYSPLPLIGDPAVLVTEGNLTAPNFVGPASSAIDNMKLRGHTVAVSQLPLSIAALVSKESDKIKNSVDPRSPSTVALQY